jgi:2-C-methyl-D-erythritol 4-phosphate cytidylyltransferase
MKPIALVVAGGTGTRMGASIPKQFLLLGNRPVLMHTLERFHAAACDLILVLPEYQISYWQELCARHQFTLHHQVLPGGASRFQSVKNGLEKVPPDTIVAIHDGVRPCVDMATIHRTIEGARKKGNAIACVKLKDSIRKIDDEDNFSVDRTQFVLIQTPQTFQSSLIKQAYLQPESSQFTDDASVLEKMGQQIHLVEGSYANIKITTPEDMPVAEALMRTLV